MKTRMNWQKERLSQKQLTSESLDNDNKLTLKSFFAFCGVLCFYKDQRRKVGNDLETSTVSGFQNTPQLKRANFSSALSFDRINFFTWRICFHFLENPLLCAIVFVS